MRQLRFLVLFLAIVIGVIAIAPRSQAVESDNNKLTDAKVVQIRTRCTSIQTTLNRIHANDALLRVNQGQLYDKLSSKLMAPFNSRLALNRLDANQLVSVTSSYENNLGQFRTKYQTYEVSLSDLLKIDCTKKPTQFYDLLVKTRDDRKEVDKAVAQLVVDIKMYRKAFISFAQPYRDGKL